MGEFYHGLTKNRRDIYLKKLGMTWIRTLSLEEADETLRRHYERIYRLYPKEYREEVAALRRSDGTSDSIVAAHSLLPDVMEGIFSAFAHLLSPELPLTRRQHEMIATLVSTLNRCHY